MKLFLEKGVNPNIQDKDAITALTNALGKGYTEIAKLLIDKGADLNHQL